MTERCIYTYTNIYVCVCVRGSHYCVNLSKCVQQRFTFIPCENVLMKMAMVGAIESNMKDWFTLGINNTNNNNIKYKRVTLLVGARVFVALSTATLYYFESVFHHHHHHWAMLFYAAFTGYICCCYINFKLQTHIFTWYSLPVWSLTTGFKRAIFAHAIGGAEQIEKKPSTSAIQSE